jgi:DNA-binding response OmpR family regulator
MAEGKALLVEDEADLAFLVKRNLEQQGYEVTTCGTTRAAKDALARGAKPDVLLLDVNLPDGSGFDLLRGLRGQQVFTPALFLTARTDEADRLTGFAVGGDDYVCKPFSMAELVARVGAIMRRARAAGGATFDGPGFRADFDRYTLVRGGQTFALTFLEAEVLRYLTARPNEAVSRNDLLNDVWGHDRYPTTRTIDMHVLNLRKKLEADPASPRHLLTVHGVGYKYVP